MRLGRMGRLGGETERESRGEEALRSPARVGEGGLTAAALDASTEAARPWGVDISRPGMGAMSSPRATTACAEREEEARDAAAGGARLGGEGWAGGAGAEGGTEGGAVGGAGAEGGAGTLGPGGVRVAEERGEGVGTAGGSVGARAGGAAAVWRTGVTGGLTKGQPRARETSPTPMPPASVMAQGHSTSPPATNVCGPTVTAPLPMKALPSPALSHTSTNTSTLSDPHTTSPT